MLATAIHGRPRGFIEWNPQAKTRALIETAVHAGVGNFIFSSTAAVYGTPEVMPVNEDAATRPESPYGTSKLITEWMLRDAAAAHDLTYVVLRYFNVAGADPKGRTGQSTPNATHLIKVAVQAALPSLKGQPGASVLVTGGGLSRFDPQIDAMAVQWGAMGLALGKAAQHKAVGLLHERLKADGVFVGEVTVLGAVKGTAFDRGQATLTPDTVAERLWELHQRRDAVVGLGDHLDLAAGGQRPDHAVTKQRVIVADDDPNPAVCGLGHGVNLRTPQRAPVDYRRRAGGCPRGEGLSLIHISEPTRPY